LLEKRGEVLKEEASNGQSLENGEGGGRWGPNQIKKMLAIGQLYASVKDALEGEWERGFSQPCPRRDAPGPPKLGF